MAPSRRISALGSLLLLAGTVFGVWLPAAGRCAEVVAEVVADKARVRAGPGMEHPVLNTLTKGEKVHILSTTDEWCRIALPGGKEGWVHKRLLSVVETGEKRGLAGTALENVRTGFGRGVEAVTTSGRALLDLGESQSATGGRMLDDVEQSDLDLQKKGALKVDYAAVDRMDAAPPIPRADFDSFLRAGNLAPEKKP